MSESIPVLESAVMGYFLVGRGVVSDRRSVTVAQTTRRLGREHAERRRLQDVGSRRLARGATISRRVSDATVARRLARACSVERMFNDDDRRILARSVATRRQLSSPAPARRLARGATISRRVSDVTVARRLARSVHAPIRRFSVAGSWTFSYADATGGEADARLVEAFIAEWIDSASAAAILQLIQRFKMTTGSI